MPIEDRRKYPRLSLTVEDGYFGNFKLPNNEMLAALILNLSTGGIKIAVPLDKKEKIKQGDTWLLKNIIGGTQLAFLSDIESEIRWITPLEKSKYLNVGCEFEVLKDDVRRQLDKFVSSERATRGQYD